MITFSKSRLLSPFRPPPRESRPVAISAPPPPQTGRAGRAPACCTVKSGILLDVVTENVLQLFERLVNAGCGDEAVKETVDGIKELLKPPPAAG